MLQFRICLIALQFLFLPTESKRDVPNENEKKLAFFAC